MTSLIISNCTGEIVGDLSALTQEKRKSFGWGAQRLLWYARKGDIVVLPSPPDETFLDYVTTLTGTPAASLTILIPPPGPLGGEILTPDRLGSVAFRDQLRAAIAGRQVDTVVSIYTDASVANLVQSVGIESALPGHRFSAESGDALVNSKAIFRAVAAGAGIPIAPGIVASQRHQAETAIGALLANGHHAMVKLDFAGGGLGNEILSQTPSVRAAGAQAVVVLPDMAAISRYVEERWSWLTGGRDDRLVIERFIPDATTVYAEFSATDDGCVLRGMGEILMEPVAVGEMIPPQSIDASTRSTLVELAGRLCERFRLIGYRGNICADAIVSPTGEVLFTETNGRLTASTHLHHNLVGHVIGPQNRDERVLLERGGKLTVPSYPSAIERLKSAGLAYDPATATGVVLTANYVPVSGKVTYCVVEKDIDAARATEGRLLSLMAGALS